MQGCLVLSCQYVDQLPKLVQASSRYCTASVVVLSHLTLIHTSADISADVLINTHTSGRCCCLISDATSKAPMSCADASPGVLPAQQQAHVEYIYQRGRSFSTYSYINAVLQSVLTKVCNKPWDGSHCTFRGVLFTDHNDAAACASH